MHLCVHVGHLRACGPARLAPSRWVSRGREVPSAAALGAPGFTVAWGRVPLRGRVLWLTPLRARAASGGFRLGSCLDENGRPSGPAPCGPDPLAALGSASRAEGGGRRLCRPARQAACVGAAIAASSCGIGLGRDGCSRQAPIAAEAAPTDRRPKASRLVAGTHRQQAGSHPAIAVSAPACFFSWLAQCLRRRRGKLLV